MANKKRVRILAPYFYLFLFVFVCFYFTGIYCTSLISSKGVFSMSLPHI